MIDCKPCIAKIGELGNSGAFRSRFVRIPTLCLNDCNELFQYRGIIYDLDFLGCDVNKCCCGENGVVDCVYLCGNGRLVGVDFTGSVDVSCDIFNKRLGCGRDEHSAAIIVLINSANIRGFHAREIIRNALESQCKAYSIGAIALEELGNVETLGNRLCGVEGNAFGFVDFVY